MITPDDIKEIASGWWREVLISSLKKEEYFPKEIPRIGKIKPGTALEKFSEIQDELTLLRNNSKEVKQNGYTIIWDTISNRKIGQNQFPKRILFETLDDYLKFTKREKDFNTFQIHSKKIINAVPNLEKWIENSPEAIIANSSKWDDIITVLRYFVNNPYPNLYIRQLPLPLHTKFIEQNQTVIASCLAFLLPNDTNPSEKTFEKKFNLRYDEPLIRVRILDSKASINGFTDVSLPLSQFQTADFNCARVVVTENKVNFLSLPPMERTIAIWSGGGFNIKFLANVDWLKAKRIIYTGDIDAHGLLILDQMRGYYPQTESFLMDRATLENFKTDIGIGSSISPCKLNHLTADEFELFEYLRIGKLRLEQEKIPYKYLADVLLRMH